MSKKNFHLNTTGISTTKKFENLLVPSSVAVATFSPSVAMGVFALDQNRGSSTKNPRLSEQTGHGEMYFTIKKMVNGQTWGDVAGLLEEIRIFDKTVDELTLQA